MKDKLINLIKNHPIDGISTRVKHSPDLLEAVSVVSDAPRLIEKIYCYINDLPTPPACPCGNKVKFITITNGYREFCSPRCDHARQAATERRVATMKANGGVGLANPASRNKASKTNQARYGVSNTFCLPKVKDWRLNNNPMKDPDIVKKLRDDCLSSHGVDWHSKRSDVISTARSTMLSRYGVENFSQSHYSDETLATLTDHSLMKELFDNNSINEISNKLEVSETTVLKYLNMLEIRSQREITPEIQLKNWLIDLGFKDFDKTRKVLPNNKEIDLYSPSLKIGIEYCGLYWHSQLYKDRNYHRNKYLDCSQAGIRLVTIFEDEWIKNQTIVKDRLKHIIGMNLPGCGARSLEIIKSNHVIAREYFQKNHISGHANAGVYYAAIASDGSIKAMMSFGKNRKIVKPKIDWQWEMVRFATDGGHYPGVAARLFKTFVRENSPESVLSYADLRWGQGTYLRNLGFNRFEDTPPNYWYFSLKNAEYDRYHRFHFNKQALIKKYPDLISDHSTEYSIARSAGFERIWDCGNAKWIWKAD